MGLPALLYLDLIFMRCIVSSLCAAWLGIILAGAAEAHSVYVAPPVHVAHGGAKSGSSAKSKTVVNVINVGPYGQVSGGMSDGSVAPTATAPVVQSDEERYRQATGKTLPAKHGLVQVPATTANGDSTYIWGNSGTN